MPHLYNVSDSRYTFMKHIRINIEAVLAALTFGLSAVVTWHVFTIGMMKALVDENSPLKTEIIAFFEEQNKIRNLLYFH